MRAKKPTLSELLANMPDDETGLEALSTIIATYPRIEVARIAIRIAQAGQHDPSLESLFNKRTIRERAEKILISARHSSEHPKPRRSPPGVAILMVDIDFFKKQNDSFGHPAGDVILASVATTMQKRLRPTDLVGRYGGEEFLIVIVGTDMDGAITAAENVRVGIESGTFTPDGSPVTVSIGIALSGATYALEELIKRADAALYEAKHEGRNCVCVAYAEDDYRHVRKQSSP